MTGEHALNDRAVVCGMDASDGGRRAAATARGLAVALEAPLVLAHVLQPPWIPAAVPFGVPVAAAEEETELQMAVRARDVVLQQAAELGIDEAAVEIETSARVSDGLRRIVRRCRGQLLVLGARAHSGVEEALLGSVTVDALRDSTCPVVAVPPDAGGTFAAPGRSVVCGVDDSPASREALAVADALALRLDAGLVVVHAVPLPSVAAVAPASAGFGGVDMASAELADRRRGEALLERVSARTSARTERRLCTGSPVADAITAVADDECANLVVIGTRAHGALRAALLGSASRRLAACAPAPVVIVAEGGAEAVPGAAA